MMELFAWETEPGFALHILNYTNPHMTRPFFREFYPIGPLQVEINVSAGNWSQLRPALELTFPQPSLRFLFPAARSIPLLSVFSDA